MKKIYFLTILIITTTLSEAQPGFTHENCFPLNAESKINYVLLLENYDSFISKTGTSYTWDLTASGGPGPWLTWTEPVTSYKFQPSSLSIHSPFYHTQINEYCLTPFVRDLFYTYSNDRDTLYYDGIYLSSNYLYRPRVPFLNFPLSFGDSTRVFLKQFANPNLPNTATGSVTRTWIYDGFGTLKLPYGAAQNVFRIKTKQIDSIYLINSATVYEEIIWFKQSDGIPVLRFQKNGTLINAWYSSVSEVTPIQEPGITTEISIYPVPFTDQLTISNLSFRQIKRLSVFDQSGRLVIRKENLSENQLNTRHLNKGVYFLEIELSDNSLYQKKLIK